MDTRQTSSTEQYILSSRAAEVPRGKYRTVSIYADTVGTLTLNRAGRVTFILLSGRVVLSAPIACVQYRFELQSYHGDILHLKVGARSYHLSFYETEPQPTSRAMFVVVSAEAENRKTFVQWQEQFEKYKRMPPDDQPIVAADIPKAKGKVAAGIVTAVGLILTIAGITTSSTSFFMLTLVAGLGLLSVGCVMQIVGVIVTDRRRAAAFANPNKDISTKPADVLPAGTLAAKG